MQRTIALLFFLLIPFFTMAQNDRTDKRKEKKERISEKMRMEEDGITYFEKGFAFGFKLISDGWAGFFELQRAKSIDKATLFQLEFASKSNKKERKFGSRIPYGNSYVYGKENFVYPVKLGMQMEQLLGNKASKNGVSVKANYGGGIILGLLRPYYAQIYDGNGGSKFVKYNSADSLLFMDRDILIAGPTFGKGWSDLKVVPGAYVKGGIRFDYGRFNELISAVEVGVSGEIYTQNIPIMAYEQDKKFFFGGYVSILFGKRK